MIGYPALQCVLLEHGLYFGYTASFSHIHFHPGFWMVYSGFRIRQLEFKPWYRHSIFPLGFPAGSDGKDSVCNAGDPGLISGSGRSHGEGNGYPPKNSCLENSMDREAWQATVHWVTESNTTERLTLSLCLFVECGGLNSLLLDLIQGIEWLNVGRNNQHSSWHRVGDQYMVLNFENGYFFFHPYTIASTQCSKHTQGWCCFTGIFASKVQATGLPDGSFNDKG